MSSHQSIVGLFLNKDHYQVTSEIPGHLSPPCREHYMTSSFLAQLTWGFLSISLTWVCCQSYKSTVCTGWLLRVCFFTDSHSFLYRWPPFCLYLMTTEIDLTSPHPPRPYDTRSHMHTAPSPPRPHSSRSHTLRSFSFLRVWSGLQPVVWPLGLGLLYVSTQCIRGVLDPSVLAFSL